MIEEQQQTIIEAETIPAESIKSDVIPTQPDSPPPSDLSGQSEVTPPIDNSGIEIQNHPDDDRTPTGRKKNKGASDAAKLRAAQIKLVAQYFGIGYILAQSKYMQLKRAGTLQDILTKAEAGEVKERPSCPKCGSDMLVKDGRNGEFYGCSTWPNCTGTRPIKSAIERVTKEQQAEALAKMKAALDYIEAVGGVEEARRWLMVAAKALGEGRNAE